MTEQKKTIEEKLAEMTYDQLEDLRLFLKDTDNHQLQDTCLYVVNEMRTRVQTLFNEEKRKALAEEIKEDLLKELSKFTSRMIHQITIYQRGHGSQINYCHWFIQLHIKIQSVEELEVYDNLRYHLLSESNCASLKKACENYALIYERAKVECLAISADERQVVQNRLNNMTENYDPISFERGWIEACNYHNQF